MALPDLTGQNIQDTYQRVLQTDDGTLRDGTGSLVSLKNLTLENIEGGALLTLNASSGDNIIRFKDLGESPAIQWDIGRDNTQQNFVISRGSGLDISDAFILTPNDGLILNTNITASGLQLPGGGTIEAPSVSGGEDLTLKAAGKVDVIIDSNANGAQVNETFKVIAHDTHLGTSTELFVVSEHTGHHLIGNITASGDISASGYIYSDRVYANNFLSIDGGFGLLSKTGDDNDARVNVGNQELKKGVKLFGNVTCSNNLLVGPEFTGSFGRVICTTISASSGDFDADTIRIGGTPFNKAELDLLKEGKSIRTNAKDLKEGDGTSKDIIVTKGIFSVSDDDTLLKFGNNIMGCIVSGSPFLTIQKNDSTNRVTVGNGTTDLQFRGNINEATLDGGTF